ncbi:hypothetical protein [Undibacterium sp. Ji49W]|uniref:hypothetical protein n=1 Tax=Undibacterium sp. Ji49W TaxID=3413040 RepID=UPI003BF24D7B
MNSSEIFVCEKCGGLIEVRREGSTQGLFCTKCDWSLVTTYLPEILRDETTYEVSVTLGYYKNDQHIKTVAELAGVNFLKARKLFQAHTNFVVFTGKASQATLVKDALQLAGLSYEIKPPFPW